MAWLEEQPVPLVSSWRCEVLLQFNNVCGKINFLLLWVVTGWNYSWWFNTSEKYVALAFQEFLYSSILDNVEVKYRTS